MDGNTKIVDLLDDEVIEHKAHEDGAIDKDFYDKIRPWAQDTLDNLERRYYSRPWFGKAWQEYRKHILETEDKNKKNPGFVFKKYVLEDEGIKSTEKDFWISDGYMFEELRSHEMPKDCAQSAIDKGKDFIEHHGIKDMKWGVRRYQNEDGTLTEEGKARYGKAVDKLSKESGLDKATAAKYVVSDGVAQNVKTQIKGTQDIANGVKSIADETARLIPQNTGKTVRGQYPDLSDKELNERINRMNLEQKYSDLKGDTKYIKSGQDKTREALQTIGAVVAMAGTIAGIANVIYGMKHPGKGGNK